MTIRLLSEKIYRQKNFSANSTSVHLANEGQNLLIANRYDEAIDKFQQSIAQDETNYQSYFDMARAYTYKKDFKNAVTAYDNYLQNKPDDIEAITMKGECLKNLGSYQKAKIELEKALSINPKYDYAARNLAECKNYEKFLFNPAGAIKEREEQSQKNLNAALKYAANYFPKGYLNPISNVQITFDKTSSLGGRANIAQYEHSKQKISITEDFIWAAPEVVGAYLVHECVHARDNDPYTSVREEQDAFEIQTKFWLQHSKGIEDPELNFAAELYSKSAKSLADRVEEIYKARDPYIAMTSPNHPPGAHAATNLNSASCSTPIRKYDVIA